jgi:hypothetical protein
VTPVAKEQIGRTDRTRATDHARARKHARPQRIGVGLVPFPVGMVHDELDLEAAAARRSAVTSDRIETTAPRWAAADT